VMFVIDLVPHVRANGNDWGGVDTALLKTFFNLPHKKT